MDTPVKDTLELIGKGGGGRVYLVNGGSMPLALKVGPQVGHEAFILSKLQHPHIVSALNTQLQIARDPGLFYKLADIPAEEGEGKMLMPYLPGTNLSQLLQRDLTQWFPYLNIEERLHRINFIDRVFSPLFDAIQYSHNMGIVNRDLKPSNIRLVGNPNLLNMTLEKILEEGFYPILLDWETATSLEMNINFTNPINKPVRSTETFMAPERFNPKFDASPLSDLYSIGVMIYFFFTNKTPFDGIPLEQEITSIVYSGQPSPSQPISVARNLADSQHKNTFNTRKLIQYGIPPAFAIFINKATKFADPFASDEEIQTAMNARYQTAAKMKTRFELAVRITKNRLQLGSKEH